ISASEPLGSEADGPRIAFAFSRPPARSSPLGTSRHIAALRNLGAIGMTSRSHAGDGQLRPAPKLTRVSRSSPMPGRNPNRRCEFWFRAAPATQGPNFHEPFFALTESVSYTHLTLPTI